MSVYEIFIAEEFECLLSAACAQAAAERAYDMVVADWNDIYARKLKLPSGVSLEEYCRANFLVVLE